MTGSKGRTQRQHPDRLPDMISVIHNNKSAIQVNSEWEGIFSKWMDILLSKLVHDRGHLFLVETGAATCFKKL